MISDLSLYYSRIFHSAFHISCGFKASIYQYTTVYPDKKDFSHFLLTHWHFQNFSVLRSKEIFLKNFSQNSVKNALCGVVGSERTFKRVEDTSQQAKSVRQAIARTGRFTEKGTLFLCLLRDLSYLLTKKGRERNGIETANQRRAYRGKKSTISRNAKTGSGDKIRQDALPLYGKL